MKNLNIPVGISDFERIRELNYYYVDKTGLIKTLLQGEMDQVTLITRPRRFGKTMAMNMVELVFWIFEKIVNNYLMD